MRRSCLTFGVAKLFIPLTIIIWAISGRPVSLSNNIDPVVLQGIERASPPFESCFWRNFEWKIGFLHVDDTVSSNSHIGNRLVDGIDKFLYDNGIWLAVVTILYLIFCLSSHLWNCKTLFKEIPSTMARRRGMVQSTVNMFGKISLTFTAMDWLLSLSKSLRMEYNARVSLLLWGGWRVFFPHSPINVTRFSLIVKLIQFCLLVFLSPRATPETVLPTEQASFTIFQRSSQDLNPPRLSIAKKSTNDNLSIHCWWISITTVHSCELIPSEAKRPLQQPSWNMRKNALRNR